MSELEGSELGPEFIEYLVAQELKENSKWILGAGGTPIVDMRADEPIVQRADDK